VITQNKRIKQLGLTGIHPNSVMDTNPIISANKRGRKRHGALLVGADWKIETDSDLNIILYKRGGKHWRTEGYFLRLAEALSYLVDAEVRWSDLSDLRSVVSRIESLRNEIVGIAAK
jgi:hypothetical protein